MSTPVPAETTTSTATPAAPADFSLAAFRKGEMTANGEPTTPSVYAKTAVLDETPDPEVDADPELAQAIDDLEAPTANETPAEKRARTLKHKDAARKGYATRQKNRADRAETNVRDLRARLDELERRPLASGDGDARRAPASRPAAQAEHDPTDPEPTLESVTAKYPNDPDPYGRLGRDQAAWDRRQEQRQAQAEQQSRVAHVRAQQTARRLEAQAEQGRGVHRDYDAKLDALGQLLRGHPADEVIADALAGLDDQKIGGELLYRLASKLDDLKAAVRGGQASLLRFVGRLERDITAEAPPKKVVPSAPIVSTAPDPHTPVVATTSAAPANPATRAGTELSLRELREYEKAHGSRRSA